MTYKYRVMAACWLGAVLSMPAWAAPDTSLGSAERTAVVQKLSGLLRQKYVFPDVAENVAAAIEKKDASGGYAGADSAPALGKALSDDLQTLGNDRHFVALFDPKFREKPAGAPALPSAEQFAEQRQDMAQMGYGIQKVERLPGNVGYIELRGFGPTEIVTPAYTAAMSLLAGSNALIVDLRRNGGGSPDSVAYFMSHFFPMGDQRHLNDFYDRPTGETQQSWTLPSVGVRYDKPVYVLVSPRTFSGGEECAYDFQAQKRGTVVGEVTGGGSNPVTRFSLGQGIVAAIPTARAINPVTKTNWEHIGVKPDLAVPAAQALQAAHVAALRSLVQGAKEPQEKEFLQRSLSLAEKGEREPAIYTMRR